MTGGKNICLVTRDLIGPIRNGGIGTAFHHLAAFLASEGHKVTILYTLGDHSENEPISHWIAYYAKIGVTLVPLPMDESTQPIASNAMRSSYCVYLWLKKHLFDIVHFHEWCGIGYYSLLAKSQGLALTETQCCVQLHSPTIWHLIHNASLIKSFDLIEIDFMERRSVELADMLISPSQYIVSWCAEHGWKLPHQVRVIQNLLPAEWYAETHSTSHAHRPVRELVFFGRLEWRKGLGLFCQSLKLLSPELRSAVTVTFLGKESAIFDQPARLYIDKVMADIPGLNWQIISDKDSASAMEYLKGEGRVAVMPSLSENSPYTVLECLSQGVPFLAADIGGIPELIDIKDRAEVCFPLEPAALAACFNAICRSDLAPAHAAKSWEETRHQWAALHAQKMPGRRVAVLPSNPPLVSVCVTHYNRPEMLAQTLAGIEAQDYPNIEVIVVDDGSSRHEAIAGYDELEQRYSHRGWLFLRQQNRYLGAARNYAVRHAHGEFLLFMDDDNFAKPHEISTFVKAALYTEADILTCAIEYFENDADLKDPARKPSIQIPLGGTLSGGMYENMFGDANALMRTSMFRELGGFTEMHGVGLEDFEFFAKAVATGFKLEVVPETLFYYRKNPTGMLLNTGRIQNALRAIRPYLTRYPELSTGLLLAQGYHYILPEMHTAWAQTQEQLRNLHKMFLEENAARQRAEAQLLDEQAAIREMRESLGTELISLVRRIRRVPVMGKLFDWSVIMLRVTARISRKIVNLFRKKRRH